MAKQKIEDNQKYLKIDFVIHRNDGKEMTDKIADYLTDKIIGVSEENNMSVGGGFQICTEKEYIELINK